MPHIRPIAICLFRHDDKILLAQYRDVVKQQEFYRPLGGAIEFGERASETIARELREEIGADVCDLRYLFTLENLFTLNGKPGHEIVLVFDGAFVDHALYEQPVLYARESNEAFDAVWKSLRELETDSRPLYPDGLKERWMGI